MISLFISYSRKDIEIAKKLTEAFKGQELDFWIDWEGIPPTVDWWREIERGIEQANVFVFLISPDSAKSKICRQEMDHAVKNGKRLIPVVVRDIKAEDSPEVLRSLNWIFLRENDNFDQSFNKLITAIKTDYEWVQVHSQLQVKAVEWERNNHENGFLLHGKELQDAEVQLARNSSKEPYPTALQREYVLKSRQATDRQRRITFGIAIVGIIILAVLAVFGFVQARLATEQANQRATAQANAESESNQRTTAQANAVSESLQRATAQALAEDRATIARAGELAAQSVAMREKNFQISLLLGIEAYRSQDTLQSRGTLLDGTNAKPQLIQFLTGHTDRVSSLAFSPDGRTFASSSIDGTIILWDVETRRPIGQPFNGHRGVVNCVAFSSDGKLLASGNNDGTIVLWNVASREPIGEPLTEHKGEISSVAFSPDGKTLASGSSDSTIILWNVETHGSIGDPFTGHHALIDSIAFSPDGKILASGDSDYKIILWDVKKRQPIGQRFGVYEEIPLFSLAFSPDGKMLASSGGNTLIILWDVETHKPIGEPLTGHTGYVNSIAFSPDGKTIASAAQEGLTLWNVETHQTIGQTLTEPASNVVFSPDGKTLASSGSTDHTIILWDTKARQHVGKDITGSMDRVYSVAFSPDGKTLASSNENERTTFWDIVTLKPVGAPLNHNANSIAFSPNGKILASGGCGEFISTYCVEGKVILWDVETHEPIDEPLTGHLDSISSIAFSPDGKMLASGSDDNTIILWDVESHKPVGELFPERAGHVYNVAFTPDGKTLASGDGDTIILWDVETHQPIGEIFSGQNRIIESIAFSPDGKTLASGNDDGTIILWNTETRQPIGQPLTGHRSFVFSVVFSPDGKTVASGSIDHTIILWDVETHQPIGEPLTGHTDSVSSLAFSPDGKTLASGSDDRTIVLWDVSPHDWIEQSCKRVGRNFTRAEWGKYFPSEEYRKTCEQWPLEPETITIPTSHSIITGPLDAIWNLSAKRSPSRHDQENLPVKTSTLKTKNLGGFFQYEFSPFIKAIQPGFLRGSDGIGIFLSRDSTVDFRELSL